MSEKRIRIMKDGPYIVTGGIPLKEMIITPKGHHYEMKEGRELPQSEEYHLCRCGHSTNKPFCTGAHAKVGFDGTETADRRPYMERIEDVFEGEDITLLDDGRCAFARFCHSELGDIWTATENDVDEDSKAAAIKMASECVAGRLTMIDKDGNVLEEELEPEIWILEDPERGVSAGIAVRGPIVIEAADGTEYEVRNRVALCRCGGSRNKPFCDAMHVTIAFNDGHING
ncbi:MAG: CDGSH iron-sulfur domain-containing protein [Lachnospiraceae bacterium]|jgi:CDGSH-type Zn-finger protein|nr:CDGSH iron-sulfur domain-containing protein [Lachnospiraceae bacterium]